MCVCGGWGCVCVWLLEGVFMVLAGMSACVEVARRVIESSSSFGCKCLSLSLFGCLCMFVVV